MRKLNDDELKYDYSLKEMAELCDLEVEINLNITIFKKIGMESYGYNMFVSEEYILGSRSEECVNRARSIFYGDIVWIGNLNDLAIWIYKSDTISHIKTLVNWLFKKTSSDDSPFLRSIFAARFDDLPRLVYTDWLHEHYRGEDAIAWTETKSLIKCKVPRCKNQAISNSDYCSTHYDIIRYQGSFHNKVKE